ncbi:hypothetical protein DEU50_103244 [Aeromonas salmonicida]|uniref:Uncharacterized protein n=1 Tax=Aeromonas salmonicida TaxID=645 RepID=A0AAX1PLY8_AERSA|nr:hypothetical protein DEU50_103244 [Aeromonas salmonicida]
MPSVAMCYGAVHKNGCEPWSEPASRRRTTLYINHKSVNAPYNDYYLNRLLFDTKKLNKSIYRYVYLML